MAFLIAVYRHIIRVGYWLRAALPRFSFQVFEENAIRVKLYNNVSKMLIVKNQDSYRLFAVVHALGRVGLSGSTHTRSTASNLEQVDNPLCAQANSASYR